MNPSNRSPLITGGASGINLAMSRCFRDLGLEPICSRAQNPPPAFLGPRTTDRHKE